MSKPTHSLVTVKGLASGRRYRVSLPAARDAMSLGLEEEDVVACVSSLTGEEFYKTMESTAFPGTWQDVYHPVVDGIPIYLKVVVTETRLSIVSFKRR